MNKNILIFIVMLLGFAGLCFYLLFKPIDVGSCDGNGPANGERKYYHQNGKLSTTGVVKNCLWEGTVKHFYETGEPESIENFKAGQQQGLTEYYTRDGKVWKQEYFVDGYLTSFEITDVTDQTVFSFHHGTLAFTSAEKSAFMVFSWPTTMTGNDEPFISFYKDKLLMRGREDFYVVNRDLEIEMNLRDTLKKYIPTAYDEKVDQSGNKHTFLWQRDIVVDSLKIKVFYDGDHSQSNHKVWEVGYKL